MLRPASLALFAIGLPVATSAPPASAQPPERIFNLVVYGEDACPLAEGDAIVVCARQPETERYRIPKPLRDKPAPTGGPGWASQVALMEDAGRALIPGSCSVVGTYGFTGCNAARLRQWFAERRLYQSKGIP